MTEQNFGGSQLRKKVSNNSPDMGDGVVINGFDTSELEIAAEFFRNWLPFLTRGLCANCQASIQKRIESLCPGSPSLDPLTPISFVTDTIEPTGWDSDPDRESCPHAQMSWADVAVQDELEKEEGAVRKKRVLEDGVKMLEEAGPKAKPNLSRDQREHIRFKNIVRKKDFMCMERVRGKNVNVLEGLELHTGIFSLVEQNRIVDFIYELQEKGKNNQLGERTYSEPSKWMRGKGRVTIQFGCCYNYAKDKNGNPPGIIKSIISDPLPQLFKTIVRRLVRWHVIPPSCVPDSCIVNVYEPGDCIPPHIDSLDFVRPFTTVSFLSECNILFGSELKIEGPGEFSGSVAIPLPVGSVLVINGNGADVAKHCVPAVPSKRISITFRKMDERKRPFDFVPEVDLQNLEPLSYDPPLNVAPDGSPPILDSSWSAIRTSITSKHGSTSVFFSGDKWRNSAPKQFSSGPGRDFRRFGESRRRRS